MADEIKDRKGLEAWLRRQQQDIASLVAVRASLRVLPLALAQAGLAMPLLRANHSAWFASLSPNQARAAGATAGARAATLATHAVRSIAPRAADAATAGIAAGYASARATTAASAAPRAADAASYATLAAEVAGEAVWAEILEDGRRSVWLGAPAVLDGPLWRSEKGAGQGHALSLPGWIRRRLNQFKRSELARDNGFAIWTRWYDDRLLGRRSPGWDDEEIGLRIATQPDEWWERGPSEVNADIAGWLKAFEETARQNVNPRPRANWDFFLSYTGKDAEIAKMVGGIARDGGYSVFAQYSHMPPGSNFTAEMMEGLEQSERLIAIISDEYLKSEYGRAELLSIFKTDPLGLKRKLVLIVARPCVIPRMLASVVHVAIYGLDEFKARERIIEALSPWSPPTRSAARARAKATASPLPVVKDGALDISRNAQVDEPYIDEELPLLPERQRQLISLALKELRRRNAPDMLTLALKQYAHHLKAGAAVEVSFLKDLAPIIAAEAQADDAVWYTGGVQKAIEGFLLNHNKIVMHYPLDISRDRHISDAPIDVEGLDKEQFLAADRSLADAVRDAVDTGVATEAFGATVERDVRIAQDIAALPKPSVPNDALFVRDDARITPDDLLKRQLYRRSGFLDQMLDAGSKVTSVANSDAGRALFEVGRALLKKIWPEES